MEKSLECMGERWGVIMEEVEEIASDTIVDATDDTDAADDLEVGLRNGLGNGLELDI